MRVRKVMVWMAAILLVLFLGTHWEEILASLQGRGVMPLIEQLLRES
jgi:hypothetical protein